MSTTWIGNIVLSQEDGIYDDDGVKYLDLLECDGSEIDETVYPNLYAALATTTLPTMTSPSSTTPYRIVADLTE